MISFFEGFLNLIYPRLCVCCGCQLMKNEQFICSGCEYEMPKTRFHQDPHNHVSQLFWGRVYFEHATAYLQFRKNSGVQQIIHHIKYKGEKSLGVQMGKYFGSELLSSPFQHVDVIIPVPLHKTKHRKRGFNQSEVIASGIAEVLNKPLMTHCLIRKNRSETQTNKSRFDRWKNVEKIFHIDNFDCLKDKHILLVDDVVTTGATIEACAAELLQIPGVKVSLAALAVAMN
jgi:ComF family protein